MKMCLYSSVTEEMCTLYNLTGIETSFLASMNRMKRRSCYLSFPSSVDEQHDVAAPHAAA